MSDHTLIRTLEGGAHAITCLAVSPGGHLLAAGSTKGNVRLWQIKDGHLSTVYQDIHGALVALTFDSKEKRLGAISNTGEVRIWDIDAMKSKPDWQGEGMLPPGSQQEKISIWKIAAEVTNCQLQTSHTQFLATSFSPDGSLLIAGYGSGMTNIWRLEAK